MQQQIGQQQTPTPTTVSSPPLFSRWGRIGYAILLFLVGCAVFGWWGMKEMTPICGLLTAWLGYGQAHRLHPLMAKLFRLFQREAMPRIQKQVAHQVAKRHARVVDALPAGPVAEEDEEDEMEDLWSDTSVMASLNTRPGAQREQPFPPSQPNLGSIPPRPGHPRALPGPAPLTQTFREEEKAPQSVYPTLTEREAMATVSAVLAPSLVGQRKPVDASVLIPVMPTQEEMEPVFPEVPADEMLRLGVTITGRRFDPHFDRVFGRGIISVANMGNGKSNTNALILESAGRARVGTCVYDYKGEYPLEGNLPYMDVVLCGMGTQVDFQLTQENAHVLVKRIVDEGIQAIILLPTYGESWLARARIMTAMNNAFMAYAQDLRAQGEYPAPCLLICDEAHMSLSQDPSVLPPETQTQEGKVVLQGLNNSFFTLVTVGRDRGITLVFSTTSLTFIAKRFIKSCQIAFIGCHREKNDLDQVEDTLNGSQWRKIVENLQPGEAVVRGLTRDPEIVRFDLKEGQDMSRTPKMADLRSRKKPVLTQVREREEENTQPVLSSVPPMENRAEAGEPSWCEFSTAQKTNETHAPSSSEKVEEDDPDIDMTTLSLESFWVLYHDQPHTPSVREMGRVLQESYGLTEGQGYTRATKYYAILTNRSESPCIDKEERW